MLPIYWLLSAAAVGLLWIGFNPVARYRYRHIPGPFALPFIGHLVPIGTIYLHIWFKQLHKQYGPIFKVWYGATPWVVICEPEAMRKVAYKCQNRFKLPTTLLGEPLYSFEHNLFLVHSDKWNILRKAWDPVTLHSGSLQGYAPLLRECAERLAERLAPAASSGEVVDVHHAITGMTLEGVGECAFGIKFRAGDTTEDTDGWAETGRQLQSGTIKFFLSQEEDRLSIWGVLAIMLPPLEFLFKRLAYLLPDRGHTDADEGQWELIRGSTRILEASRQQRQQAEAAALAAAGNRAGGAGAQAEGAQGGGGAIKRVRQGVQPGSFAVKLEEWKSKFEGQAAVSDPLLVAQILTFIVAGYETTASALAILVYHLAVNPEAQERVQQELDAVLGGRPPAYDDIPKLVYLDACIKETLRMNTPGAVLIRGNDLATPLDVLGKRMPQGARLFMCNHGVQTDGTYWEQPDAFLPHRFLPEANGKLGPRTEHAYLPFGMGARKCVGYKFAELQLALAAATLLARYSFTRPVGEGPLRTKTGLSTGPVDGVRVHVHPRA